MMEFPCVNCDGPIPWDRRVKVYCTSFCREQAKNIRWIRSTRQRGVENDPDVQEALRIRLAHLRSGGYMALGRRIPINSRFAIRDKFNDICASCEGDASDGEIDHIRGSSNSLDNLQLLCQKCHREKTLGNIKPIEIRSLTYPVQDPRMGARAKNPKLSEFILSLEEEISERISSINPIRVCDDHSSWSEKESELRKSRRVKYHQSLLPVIEREMSNRLNIKSICEKLNESSISTMSGSGKWSRESTRELISNNDITIEYLPKEHKSKYVHSQRGPL